MKQLTFLLLTILSITTVVTQAQTTQDSISIKYFLSPAKGYEKDIMPKYKAYIKINGKKYDLKTTVMINTAAGDQAPEIVYNKKAKRNEYLLKTWFAGGGTNFKAYISGSKASNTATVNVYAQDLDEQAPASKWRLVRAVKL